MCPNNKKKGYLLTSMMIHLLAKAAEDMYSCSKEYRKGWRDARQNVCKTDTVVVLLIRIIISFC
jgi:hypothetical protein